MIPDQASPNLRKAATELQTYILSMSGAKLPVRINGDKQPQPTIFIGNFEKINVLQPNEIRITTRDNDLHITGGTPQDVLFATYTFLEESLDCRFYAPDGAYIPQSPALIIPADLQYNYMPPVTTRTVQSHFPMTTRTLKVK